MINITTNTQKTLFNKEDFPKLSQTFSTDTYHHSNLDNSSDSSTEAIFIQTIKDAFQNSKCPHGNPGTNLCSNPNCKETALFSVIKKCPCTKIHKNCSAVVFYGFLDNYQLKLKEEKRARSKVQKIFEKLIDQISLMEDQIIKHIRGSFITMEQHKFLLKVQNQDYSSLKGKQIASIFSHINQQDQIDQHHQLIDELVQNLESLSKESIESLKNLHQDLQKQNNSRNLVESQKYLTQSIIESQTAFKIDSKIVSGEKQIQTLRQFFTKKPMKGMKLLYRASENKFSMEKFYEKCSNIPHTLILVKTEFNKIIGGYTPLIWKQYTALKTKLEDPSLQSFIFSITEKEKLQLTQQENATYYLSYVPGPRFGKQGCADLWICDKSNQEAESYVFGNMSYKNPKYSSCTESYKKFVGGWSEYFKTKEWQVFQVSFQ